MEKVHKRRGKSTFQMADLEGGFTATRLLDVEGANEAPPYRAGEPLTELRRSQCVTHFLLVRFNR